MRDRRGRGRRADGDRRRPWFVDQSGTLRQRDEVARLGIRTALTPASWAPAAFLTRSSLCDWVEGRCRRRHTPTPRPCVRGSPGDRPAPRRVRRSRPPAALRRRHDRRRRARRRSVRCPPRRSTTGCGRSLRPGCCDASNPRARRPGSRPESATTTTTSCAAPAGHSPTSTPRSARRRASSLPTPPATRSTRPRSSTGATVPLVGKRPTSSEF